MKLNSHSLKFILYSFVLLFIFSGCRQEHSVKGAEYLAIPDPKTLQESYVSNPDNILSAETVTSLNTKLSSLDQSGRAHIDVVVVETIGEAIPKSAATALFRKWKIGNKQTNNGLLILVVKDQHRIEFETGYGLEGDLPDLVCYRIQQKYMIPHARNNDFNSAVQDGVKRIIDQLNQAGDAVAAPGEKIAEKIDTGRVSDNGIPYVKNEVIMDSAGNLIDLDRNGIDGDIVESNPDTNPTPLYQRHTTGDKLTFFIFTIFLVLMLLLDKRFNGDKRKYRLLSPLFWLTFIIPFALVIYLNWFHYTVHYNIRTIIIFYVVTALYTNYHFFTKRNQLKSELKDKSRYEQYKKLVKQQGNLKWAAYLCPLPWLWSYYKKFSVQIDQLRNDPYNCETCGGPMWKLTEAEDDGYLEKGQVVEERLLSKDYDVWECTSSPEHEKLVLDYKGVNEAAVKCPECAHYTFMMSRKKIVQKATTSSAGWGWQFKNCAFCNHEERVKYIIPEISEPSGSRSSSSGFSSSSGSSRSSSSSSSSSGGSSGGGGSGSSW